MTQLASVRSGYADSLVAAMKAGETWPGWRLITAGVIGLAVVVILALLVSEYFTVKQAGGLKVYTKDLDLVSFSSFRSLLAFEVVLGALVVAVLLHAILPKLVSELQIDAVWVVAGMAAAGRGITLAGFGIKQVNADPAVMVTAAAIKDPDVQPLVTTNKKTGDTTVAVVPSELAKTATAAALASTNAAAAAAAVAANVATVRPATQVVMGPPVIQPVVRPVITRDA